MQHGQTLVTEKKILFKTSKPMLNSKQGIAGDGPADKNILLRKQEALHSDPYCQHVSARLRSQPWGTETGGFWEHVAS